MRRRLLRRGRRRLALRRAAAALAVAAGFGCNGSDGGGDRETFCALATQRGEESLLDPDVTQQQLDRLGVVYEELADAAPSDVSDDADFANDAVQRLREGDVSFIADEEQANRLIEALEAIDDYVRDECP